MERAPAVKKRNKAAAATNPLQPRVGVAPTAASSKVHVFGNRVVCDTDSRGFANPHNGSPLEIVLDATEGFIPLWEKNTTLRWRFRESSIAFFEDPEAAKTAIEGLFGESLLAWGDAAPVKFAKRNDAWDFEIVMRPTDNCSGGGCVLASAFFPDSGRHKLTLYPKLFEQSREEQIATFVHEVGHVFGLRHFFAQISETEWRSEIFGEHEPFSIMNYGHESVLTAADRSDLKKLYEQVWSGELTAINGTPIKLMKPFHAS